MNIYISFLFMLAITPVFGKLFNGKDFFEFFNLRLLYITPFAILFFILLVSYISKCYKSILKRSDTLIEEIEE